MGCRVQGVGGVVLRTCLCLTANTGKGDTEFLLDRNVFLENHLSPLDTGLLLPLLGVQPPPGAARLPPDPPAAEDGVLAHVVDLPYLGAGRGVCTLRSLGHGGLVFVTHLITSHDNCPRSGGGGYQLSCKTRAVLATTAQCAPSQARTGESCAGAGLRSPGSHGPYLIWALNSAAASLYTGGCLPYISIYEY